MKPTHCLLLVLGPVLSSACNALGPSNPVPVRSERVEVQVVDERHEARLLGFENHVRPQEKDVWCWAACAQMIHSFNGKQLEQSELARSIHGLGPEENVRIAAATRYEIMCALNPDLPRHEFELVWNGLRARLLESLPSGGPGEVKLSTAASVNIAVDKLWPPKSIAVDDLQAGHPLVVALRDQADPTLGHLYVCSGASWTPPSPFRAVAASFVSNLSSSSEIAKNLNDGLLGGGHQVHWLELVDPQGPSVAQVPFEDVRERIDFCLSASAARSTLLAWHELIQVKPSR